MRKPDNHPPTEDFVKLLAGELAPDRASMLLTHADGCARCQQVGESVWAGALHLGDPVPPQMDDMTAETIEKRLVARLHQENLAGRLLDLGSNGFFIVVLGLLRPIIQVFSIFTVQSPRKQ